MKKKRKKNLEVVVIMIVVMLIGAGLIVSGIKGLVGLNKKTKHYVKVEGKVCGYSEYSGGKDGASYIVEYEYIVNGRKYYVSTDYATGFLPKLGSIKTIKYNPYNPSESIITGGGNDFLSIVFGAMFFFMPLVILIGKSRKKSTRKEKKLEFVVSMTIMMLIGVGFIVFGIKDSVDLNEKAKHYVSVEGRFCDYSEYSRDSDGVTYSLEYEYIVNGRKYYVSTDYGTGVIPELGSIKTIKYNPYDPSEAIITGGGNNLLLLGLGFMFFFIPLLLLMSESSKKNEKEEKKRFKSFCTSMLFGIAFTGMGIGAYYIMGIKIGSFSLANFFKCYVIYAIIPIIFTIIGIYMIVISLFPPKKKEVILNVEDITEYNNGNYAILLADVSIAENSIKARGNKYYVYNTKNKEKFEIGKEFKVNIYKYGVMHEGIQISKTVQARYLKLFVDSDFEVV